MTYFLKDVIRRAGDLMFKEWMLSLQAQAFEHQSISSLVPKAMSKRCGSPGDR